VNLAILEDHLLAALRTRLGGDVELRAGPPAFGPATGLRAQVFVHAADFSDGGGVMADGMRIARHHWAHEKATSGFTEARPGTIDIEVSCICGQHGQASLLAGLVVPTLLESLETLAPPLLSDPADAARRLRFGDCSASVRSVRSERIEAGGVAAGQVTITLRLDGFLHVHLASAGGLRPQSVYEASLRLEIDADPAGTDVQRECVIVHNGGARAVALGGWTLRDAAKRPHAYTFPPARRIAAGRALRVWSGRGTDDADNVYWGRRKAVWNNTGDIARLLDPDGIERARTWWSPPLPG
jgi:hypothetical protein